MTMARFDRARTRRSLLLPLLVLLAAAPAPAQERIRGTNRHYRPGDWVTWSSSRHVRQICVAPDRIYFATTGGITCFNPFSQRWEEPMTVSSGLASGDIELVGYDEQSGYLWCAHPLGVSHFGPASQVWENYFYDEIGLGRDDRVVSLGFADDRMVWLATRSGRFYASHGSSGDFMPVDPPPSEQRIRWYGAAAAAEPPPPYLFLPNGFYYDQQEQIITDSHNRRFRLTDWVRDPWQNLWIATWGLGAARVDLPSSRYYPLPFGLWDDAVDALGFDQDALWLAGDQESRQPAGMTRWQIGEREPEYFEPRYLTGFSDDRITAMAFDEKNLWFGTRNGLTRYEISRRLWQSYDETDHLSDVRITDLHLDDRYLWIASSAGLSRLHRRTLAQKDSLRIEIIDPRNLGRQAIYRLAAQGDTLWVGTEWGLYWYDAASDTGAFWTEGFFPEQQAIRAVTTWADEVWFGTDEGIAGFNPRTGEWFAPPAQRYDIPGRINRMTADGASVWAATEEGVLRYERESKRWIHYTMEDGLPALAVRSLLLDGDYIWLGSRRGLTLFYWNAPYRID